MWTGISCSLSPALGSSWPAVRPPLPLSPSLISTRKCPDCLRPGQYNSRQSNIAGPPSVGEVWGISPASVREDIWVRTGVGGGRIEWGCTGGLMACPAGVNGGHSSSMVVVVVYTVYSTCTRSGGHTERRMTYVLACSITQPSTSL